tara:strand:- start:2298 stop:3848 length:1551 start_codon:yes stop_codon:yes gene_type:complete
MARSTRRDTDFNIREALKRTRSQLLSAQESGRAALAGYEELAPAYNRAVEQARNYQGTLTRDYNRYIQDRNQAVDTYNQQLQQRYQTYQGAVEQGSGLERTFRSAEQELNRLSGIKDSAAQQATQLYGTYSSQYSSATKTGQQRYQSQLGSYRAEIDKLQREAEGYSANITALTKDIQAQQRQISANQNVANLFLGSAEIGGRYVVDSTNKIYRVFTDAQNRYQGAQEYQPGNIGSLTGLARGLGRVTDSGYGSLTNAIKFLSKRGTMTFSDAVYETYRRGATNYSTYENVANRAKAYSGYVQTAYDRIGKGQTQIANFQTGIRNNEQRITGLTTQISGVNTNLENLLKDTGYVTRYAQQQSAGALQNYERYLRDTYNPSVASYNQYASGTYTPAAQAYQNFMGSGQVQQALQSYQSLAQDTGFVDRAASDTKAVYDASQQEYSRLQAAYEGMAPQLSEYTQQAESAKQQVLSLQGMTPELQRSLAIDTEARKRGTRLGYRRSVLSQDFKRRGAAR